METIFDWKAEIARWFEEATGKNLNALHLTEESDLLDIIDDHGRAKEVLLQYGVDIDENDTNLVRLAKITYARR